jgi:hypothetical protein
MADLLHHDGFHQVVQGNQNPPVKMARPTRERSQQQSQECRASNSERDDRREVFDARGPTKLQWCGWPAKPEGFDAELSWFPREKNDFHHDVTSVPERAVLSRTYS